ncbi:MAG: beta-lactamase family protein [Bacteroidales bacterium]|nr:beta-lactamase family protein [Bacteroidales bacterium]
MDNFIKVAQVSAFLCLAVFALPAVAQQASTQIEKALKVEGARVTLPVGEAITKDVFTPEWIDKARKSWDNFHFQMGGDHALYYAMHLQEFMYSAESAPSMEYRPLERNIRPEIRNVRQQTSKGNITLEEYMNDTLYRAQGMMMIHKGKVVYESYPGMRPSDRHLTSSTGKITCGLVIAQLIKEGKIDEKKNIADYIPELKNTAWDGVTVYSVANMCTALDNEETIEHILQPDSPVTRFLAACAGSPRATTGKLETWLEVAQDQQKLPGNEKQGEVFRYASINTAILTKLAENVENKNWGLIFEERVWSKVHARRSILFPLSPTGFALPLGFVAATLEDYTRFAAMFTPSWNAVSSERIVDEDLLKLFYDNIDKERYAKGAKLQTSIADFNEAAMGNALQWDFIWEDGAMAKSGNLCQMIYVDPKRDFASVFFSLTPFVDGYGEFKAGAFQRAAAKMLNGE